MRRIALWATLGVGLAAVCAEGAEGAVATKTGTVRKVDAAANQIVVMVTREMAFTVTEATKIVQGEDAKTLADVRVGGKVSVDYTREGDTRTAVKIVILAADAGAPPAAEQPKAPTQAKTGTVTKVDAEANQIVVMVARDLTFTVTEATKIVQGEEAKKLTDIKVGAKVTVDYTRVDQTRTATRIAILPEK